MTFLVREFLYDSPLREITAQALNEICEVYGIRSVRLNDGERRIAVEYDSSRLTEYDIALML